MRAGLGLTAAAVAAISMLPVAAAAQGAAPVTATLARLSWLPGIWTGTAGPASFEERWTPAAGGAMLAVSRTLRGNQMVGFEFLRIIERDGTLIYVAQPGGNPPTEFRLTSISADSVTFENRAHDFPKVIVYARRADGALEARVSDGGQKGETFVFRRGQ